MFYIQMLYKQMNSPKFTADRCFDSPIFECACSNLTVSRAPILSILGNIAYKTDSNLLPLLFCHPTLSIVCPNPGKCPKSLNIAGSEALFPLSAAIFCLLTVRRSRCAHWFLNPTHIRSLSQTWFTHIICYLSSFIPGIQLQMAPDRFPT